MTRALVLVVLLVSSGCGVSMLNRATPPAEAEQLVTEAEALVKTGNYPAAARLFEDVVKRFPAAPVHDRALYGLARTLVLPDNSGRDYRQAYLCFDRLLRVHPGSPYAPDARAWRGLLVAYFARVEELGRLKKLDILMERQRRQ